MTGLKRVQIVNGTQHLKGYWKILLSSNKTWIKLGYTAFCKEQCLLTQHGLETHFFLFVLIFIQLCIFLWSPPFLKVCAFQSLLPGMLHKLPSRLRSLIVLLLDIAMNQGTVLFIFPCYSHFPSRWQFWWTLTGLVAIDCLLIANLLRGLCLGGQFLLHRLPFHIAIVVTLKLYNSYSDKCHQGKITLSTLIFIGERYILYSLIQRWLYIPKTNSILFTFSMLCFTHPLLPISLNLLGGSYDLVIFMPSVKKAQSGCTLEGNKKNL